VPTEHPAKSQPGDAVQLLFDELLKCFPRLHGRILHPPVPVYIDRVSGIEKMGRAFAPPGAILSCYDYADQAQAASGRY
jgi:hypothetical protein